MEQQLIQDPAHQANILATTTKVGGPVKNEDIVAFLRREADQAEERAKRLREFADSIDVDDVDDVVDETAPLDENGVPKYKGKKRGRKPKKRQRKRNPNAKKRKHTAYTLFVQETYPKVKQQFEGNVEFQSKNVISIVAKQWKDVPEEDKKEWKRRAREMSQEEEEEDDHMEDVDEDALQTLPADQESDGVLHHRQNHDQHVEVEHHVENAEEVPGVEEPAFYKATDI